MEEYEYDCHSPMWYHDHQIIGRIHLESEEKKMEKTKIFISQPMNGKTNTEIKTERKAIEKWLADNWIDSEHKGIEILDSFFEDEPHDAKPLYYLSKSLELLSKADVAVFAKGWQNARGCKMEHEAALEYGIATLEPNYEVSILDDVEKKYLGNIISPFKRRIKSIVKKDTWTENSSLFPFLTTSTTDERLAYIVICLKDHAHDGNIFLPCFNKKSGMYGGMELNKEYTLEELGL